MLEICALASGSNGNCYYIGDDHDALLIDCGISKRLLLERMGDKGLNPHKIKAIFITHEHKDHIQGAKGISAKLDIPVYLTKETLYGVKAEHRPHNTVFIEGGGVFKLGFFSVFAVKKQHDASNPVSFRIENRGFNVGVFTDIGAPCDGVITHIKNCNFLFLESNYDEALLWSGRYPDFLKKRVASDVGHLSNKQCRELVELCNFSTLKTIYLSHISEDNNSHELVKRQFNDINHLVNIQLTNRYAPTEVIKIEL